jgi:hypothetical protein
VAYKVFTNGSVLNASEVNDNLMNQAVITFTNSTARASAITSPVEGMVTYLADTDTYQFWNGTAWTNLVSSTVGSGNAIINGGFDIWQRGTSGLTIGNSLTNAFSADRWSSYRAANHTAISVSRQTGSGVPGAPSLARIQRTASNSSTETVVFGQTIEIANATPFAGQTVTFSYYLRAGANYSASGSSILAKWKSGTGTTDLNGIYNIYPGTVDANSTHVLSSTFQRFSQTISVPANATQIAISFEFTPTGTAGAADFFEITGVQIEAGSTATPFRRNANSLQGELAACQRYYFRSTGQSFRIHASGVANANNTAVILFRAPVTLRVVPTSVEFSNLNLRQHANSGAISVSNITVNGNQDALNITTSTTSLTAGTSYTLENNDSAAAFVAISAEL